MDLSKFTEKAQVALSEAQDSAVRFGHQGIDVEHVLDALLKQEGGLAPRLLERAGVNIELLTSKLEEALNRIPKVSGSGGNVYLTQRTNQLYVRAQDEAKKLKDEYTSVEHVLLAMFDESGSTPVGKIFKELHLTRNVFLKAMMEVRGNQRVTSQNPLTRRWKNTDAISQSSPSKASSIRSSAATWKFAAPSRFFPAAQKTIPYSSVNRVWARPRLWKASRSESSRGMFPKV